jgi:hypothetical protein
LYPFLLLFRAIVGVITNNPSGSLFKTAIKLEGVEVVGDNTNNGENGFLKVS